MPIWLISLLPIAWRFLRHFGVYILLTAVLIGSPYLLYRKGHNDGYKSKVCPPTYNVGSGGVVNNQYNADDYKVAGMRLKLLFLKLQFGY